MKRKLFPLLLALAACLPAALLHAGVIIPLKIDDSDNTLTTLPASQFYSANPVPWSNVSSTPTTLDGYGITDGFDGAFSSLSETPTTLAGYGIIDAQPLDADLTSFANLVWDLGSTELRIPIYNDQVNQFQATTVTPFSLLLLNNTDAATARTTLGLEIGTDVLAPDGDGSGLTNLPDGAGFSVLTPTPPTGTSLAVDLEDKSLVEIDTSFATSDVALALSNAVAGKTYKFKVSHGANARALLLPTNTLSASGSANIIASGANATDLIYAEYTGSQWLIGPRVDDLAGWEPETVTYLATLNSADGTTLNADQQAGINDLVSWLKTEGLWATTRLLLASSNYNVDSGNTVYALGGLSSSNFTKSGTVAWAASGLTLGATEQVTAPDFLPGGASLTLIFYGNVFGNAVGTAVSRQSESGANERSFALGIHPSNTSRLRFIVNDTGLGSGWDFADATTNSIIDAEQVINVTFNAGKLDVWQDGVHAIDTTTPATTLFNSSAVIDAADANYVGTLRVFAVSTTVWTPAQLTTFETKINAFDWN